MDRKGLGAMGALLLVGGFLVVMGVVPTVSHNLAVQENQPTEATVQSTDVAVKTDDDGDTSYRPVVTYAYTVDGETYTNDNVFPGGFTRWDGSREWAERIAGQYDPGDAVTVQYRPGHPDHAYLRNDGWPDAWGIGSIAILILVVGGAGLVTTGFTRRKQRTLMRDTPTEDVESMAVGPSEVKGSALAADGDPFPAPFSDDDCVVVEYEVEQYHEDDDGGNWNTVAQGVVHTPFYVDDGTGRVLVEPHDEATFDLDPDDRETVHVDSSERGPEPVQRFVERTEAVSYPADAPGSENDRRYHQTLIRDKESVYVFGTARPWDGDHRGGSNPDRLVIRHVADDDGLEGTMFLISDDAEAGLVNRREWAGLRIPAGGGFVVIGFASALFMAGPLVGLELPVLF
jgi:hypothetical protein